jgi:hypothetical protein
MPSSSRRNSRALAMAARASACRPARYRASTSSSRLRSCSGSAATRSSTSGTTSAARPRSRSAAIRSSSAKRRAASRRRASAAAKDVDPRPAYASPRHSLSASRKLADAAAGRPSRCARRPISASLSKARASIASSATTSRYPPGSVTSTSGATSRVGSRSLRSRSTWFCSDLVAVLGGWSPHNVSMSTSVATVRPARATRWASNACSLDPGNATCSSPSHTCNGPRTQNRSRVPPRTSSCAGIPSPPRPGCGSTVGPGGLSRRSLPTFGSTRGYRPSPESGNPLDVEVRRRHPRCPFDYSSSEQTVASSGNGAVTARQRRPRPGAWPRSADVRDVRRATGQLPTGAHALGSLQQGRAGTAVPLATPAASDGWDAVCSRTRRAGCRAHGATGMASSPV